MQSLQVYNTLETPVRWRTGVPGLSLVAGLVNKVVLSTKKTPIAEPSDLADVASLSITLRDIPSIETVVYTFADVSVKSIGSDVTLDLALPSDFPRGYYRCHIVAKDKENIPINVYQAWVVVDKSVSPKADKHMEATSVRTQFADICEDDNKLLDGLEVGCGDICEAVERCLQQWEATAPRTSRYTGRNFPYPEILRNGVMAMLLKTLCTLMDRNSNVYAAEGLQVNLEARAAQYKALAAEYNSNWRSAMMQAKNEENLISFTGGLVYE